MGAARDWNVAWRRSGDGFGEKCDVWGGDTGWSKQGSLDAVQRNITNGNGVAGRLC
jgi:hypothetical protein